GHEAQAAAGAGRLFPAGGLFGGERPAGRRILPLAHHREGRGGDPALALLRRAAGRATSRAAVLREGSGHAGRGHRKAGGPVSTPSDLRVSLVQGDTLWHDPDGNRRLYAELVAPLAGQTDLVVLPETFTSGFSNEALDRAEDMDGPTVAWIREQARALDAAVTGSVQLRVGEGVYNRLLWATPDGGLAHYD